MKITTLKIELFIKESQSLKDKRRVIKSLIDRIKNRYNVSIAEVGDNDSYKKSTIGLALVSNDVKFNDRQAKEILDFIYANPFVIIVKSETEIW
ncbi:MAG: DUF503 domain-containing protein [bacterium]|uniref:YlxP n=2 Tax=Bacteria candidate phyla TaxID=1783234 RepID=A0A101I3V1_UNCT6|nr:MAG: YlxP [candidate division TA06 bacterium 32_111]KUK88024.1 MAG: YlxP [candidate division TA06 bacterium 34_109]MDI6700828.1 DUF503 domain-containing protein [bacterium]HAF06952.1 DUF503 domain-containing protein [candidate division WOR-3 bacterium]HCP16866.1 DUF503 domain-containing protein [candidate division WOR-3 bacterium]